MFVHSKQLCPNTIFLSEKITNIKEFINEILCMCIKENIKIKYVLLNLSMNFLNNSIFYNRKDFRLLFLSIINLKKKNEIYLNKSFYYIIKIY